MSQQNQASASARRMQFIATTRKAVRQFDEGRAATECLRDVKRPHGAGSCPGNGREPMTTAITKRYLHIGEAYGQKAVAFIALPARTRPAIITANAMEPPDPNAATLAAVLRCRCSTRATRGDQ